MPTLSNWVANTLDRYSAGEFAGESLAQEMVRRVTWKLLPSKVLKRGWESLLLRNGGFWCFILGLNNSGTTLLHDLLGRFSAVRTLPRAGSLMVAEGQHFTNTLPVDRDHDVHRLFMARSEAFRWTEEDDSSPAARAIHDWGFRYVRRSGHVLLEKSPPNAVRGRWLQANFRDARFIAMFRQPFAVAEGIRRREGHDLRDAARHWAQGNKILLDDLQYLERSIQVKYEELCANPRDVLGELAKFLSLSEEIDRTDLGNLDLHNVGESVDTIMNMNPRSLERLSAVDLGVIASEAGPVANRLGYEIPCNL